jgi:hypothetical protein
MKIGFTGTRHGMTEAQMDAFIDTLHDIRPRITEFHHGDCVGADAEAHDVAQKLCHVVIHPPIDETHRARKAARTYRTQKTHFARNRDIVNETDRLIATPMQAERQIRGGTWYTIDYARKVGKLVTIINPDGTIQS